MPTVTKLDKMVIFLEKLPSAKLLDYKNTQA